MNKFWTLLGWIWSRKLFFAVVIASTFFFFILYFPFSDLSDVITNAVARATGNQVYVQFESLDLHIVPQPSISATQLSVETGFPPLTAKWARISPNLLGAVFSLPTAIRAANGNEEAARALPTKVGATIAAEGLLGGDVELTMRSGTKSEQGRDRSRVSLTVEKLSLSEVGKWADLALRPSGDLNAETDLQMTPDLHEQPEGEYLLKINKFNLPPGTVMVPMGEARLPVSIPAITLGNVLLKGRLVGGNLIIEEGVIGQNKDPLFGKIKGQLGLRLQPQGPAIVPVFGAYNLTVDLNTTAPIEKDLGFAFIMFSRAKVPSAGGGARYQFRATGQGIGMDYVPSITPVGTF